MTLLKAVVTNHFTDMVEYLTRMSLVHHEMLHIGRLAELTQKALNALWEEDRKHHDAGAQLAGTVEALLHMRASLPFKEEDARHWENLREALTYYERMTR